MSRYVSKIFRVAHAFSSAVITALILHGNSGMVLTWFFKNIFPLVGTQRPAEVASKSPDGNSTKTSWNLLKQRVLWWAASRETALAFREDVSA